MDGCRESSYGLCWKILGWRESSYGSFFKKLSPCVFERHNINVRRDAVGDVHQSKVKRDVFESKETYSSPKRPVQVKTHHLRDIQKAGEMPWELCTNQKSKETYSSQKRPIQVKRDLFKSKETGSCAQMKGQKRPVQVKRDLFKSKEIT